MITDPTDLVDVDECMKTLDADDYINDAGLKDDSHINDSNLFTGSKDEVDLIEEPAGVSSDDDTASNYVDKREISDGEDSDSDEIGSLAGSDRHLASENIEEDFADPGLDVTHGES